MLFPVVLQFSMKALSIRSIRDAAIGKIQLGPDSSVVEVHRDFANRMTMDMPKCKHKGKHIQVKVIQE